LWTFAAKDEYQVSHAIRAWVLGDGGDELPFTVEGAGEEW
jgi:hypothetical protein